MTYPVELSSPQRAEHDPDLPTWSARAPVRVHWSTWSASLLGLGQILLSVTAFSAEPSGRLAMLVVGALLLLSALYSLIAPGLRTEYVHMFLGLVLVSAPVTCGFAGSGGPAAWCWVLGGATVLVGLTSLPPPAATESAGHSEPTTHESEPADGRWPTWVGDLTTVADQPSGRHRTPAEPEPVPEREAAPVDSGARTSGADGGAAPASGHPTSPHRTHRVHGQGRKLDSQQVERIRAMSAETGDDGKRRYSVAHMASEFGVARSTIYRHLRSTS